MEIDQEVLQQALLEVEHLRQLEARSRRNAESLLEGLERLSSAHSQKDSVLAILSVLSSVIDLDAAVVLCEVEPRRILSLAETDPALRVEDGIPSPTLTRAMGGRPVFLSNASASGWADGLGVAGFGAFGSAALFPVTPVEYPTVIVCLQHDRARYSKNDQERLRYLFPLAAHAVRHSFKLAELRKAIAELNEARSVAEASARTDPLTGLANRMHIEERVQALLSAGEYLSFALIDLNGFKPINDNFGHQAGDDVLVEIGRRLKGSLGEDALVARIGGDEFGVLIATSEGAPGEDLGERLCAAFSSPVMFNGRQLELGASIGIAHSKRGETSAESLLLSADAAMYSVKDRRETGFAVASIGQNEKRAALSPLRLDQALEAGEIVPFYQPQFDTRTGTLCGFEVLARWEHPDDGLIMPSEFLPEIERGGLSERFTCAVLRLALEQAIAWERAGAVVPGMSINLAQANLASLSAIGGLLSMIEANGDRRIAIVFEVTEKVFLGRSAGQIDEVLCRIVNAGIGLSLDDFGTGFATLANLARLRFQELKIDRSFVAGIGRDRRSEVIIEAMIAIAHAHGARVVAEGVETPAQQDYLARIPCDRLQGFLCGAPADATETFERFLRPSRPRQADPSGMRYGWPG